MLDMGFEKDVRTIIGATPASRRTVMFTATWPEAVSTQSCAPPKPPPRLQRRHRTHTAEDDSADRLCATERDGCGAYAELRI